MSVSANGRLVARSATVQAYLDQHGDGELSPTNTLPPTGEPLQQRPPHAAEPRDAHSPHPFSPSLCCCLSRSLTPAGCRHAVPIELGAGGTADILPMERAKASFNTETLINIMDGGVTARAIYPCL